MKTFDIRDRLVSVMRGLNYLDAQLLNFLELLIFRTLLLLFDCFVAIDVIANQVCLTLVLLKLKLDVI